MVKSFVKYYTTFFGICAILVLIQTSASYGQTSIINGTIKNGTTGGSAQVASLTLIGFESGMKIIDDLRNVESSFTFENVSSSVERQYLLQAEYKGVLYNANVTIPPGGESVSVEVVVYEQTGSQNDLNVTNAQYQISMSGTTLQVLKMYNVSNESENPGTYLNEKGTFLFVIPENSHGINYITVNTGLVPINQEPISTDRPDMFAINYPIKPGVTQVSVSYHVDYTQRVHFFSENILYEMHNLVVVTTPSNIELESSQLVMSGADAHQDFSAYTSKHLSKGDQFSFSIAGGVPSPLSSVPAGQRAVPTSKIGMKTSVLLTVVIFGLLVLGSALSRNKALVREKRKKNLPKKITNRKNELINDLAALDDTFADHRIQESEYHKKRSNLKNQLIELYKKMNQTE